MSYLAAIFSKEQQTDAPSQELALAVYRRTDGNPLFMVNMVDALMRQEEKGDIESAMRKIPENLQRIINGRLICSRRKSGGCWREQV